MARIFLLRKPAIDISEKDLDTADLQANLTLLPHFPPMELCVIHVFLNNPENFVQRIS